MIGNIYMFQYRKVRNKDEFNIINKETKEVIETVSSKDDAQNKVTNLNLLKKRKFAKEKKEKKVKVPKVKILKAPKSFAVTPSKIKVIKFKEQTFPLIKKFRSVLKEKVPKVPKVPKIPKEKKEKVEKVDKPKKIVSKPALLAEINADKFKRSTKTNKQRRKEEELMNLSAEDTEFIADLAKQVSKEESKANIRKYAREFAKEKELAKPKPEPKSPKYNPERAKERRDKAKAVKASNEALAKLDAELADEEIMRKFDEAVARDETRKIKEKKALELLQKVVSTKKKTKDEKKVIEAKAKADAAEAKKIPFKKLFTAFTTPKPTPKPKIKVKEVKEVKPKPKPKIKVKEDKDVKILKKYGDEEARIIINKWINTQLTTKEAKKVTELLKEIPTEVTPITKTEKTTQKEAESVIRLLQRLTEPQQKIEKPKSIIKEKIKRTPEEIARREAILAYNEKIGKEEEEKERMRQELEIQQVEIATAKEQARQQKEDQARVKKAEQALAKEQAIQKAKDDKIRVKEAQEILSKIGKKSIKTEDKRQFAYLDLDSYGYYAKKKRDPFKTLKLANKLIKQQKEKEEKEDQARVKEVPKEVPKKEVEVKEVPKKEVPKEYELSNRKRIFIDKDKVYYKGKEVGYFRKDKIYLNDMPSSSDNKTLSLKDVTEIAPTVISSVVSQIEVPPESKPIVWVNPVVAPSPLVPFVPAPKVDTSQPHFSKFENKWGMFTDEYNTIYIDNTTSEVYDANSKLVGERDQRQRSRLNVVGELLDLEDYNRIS